MEILEPILDLIHALKDWTVGWADSPNALVALFAIAFAESSFFPIPPDALMIPMAVTAPTKALWFALVTSVGSILGGITGYWIGRWGGTPLLRRFFDPEKVLMVQSYYHKYDIWAVGIAGFTPIPYKLFSLTSGAFNLDFKRFTLATIVGRAGRFFVVGLVIFLFGDQVSFLMNEYFDVAVVAFTVLLILGFWSMNLIGKRLGGVPADGPSAETAADPHQAGDKESP